jgi:hypothetical protein
MARVGTGSGGLPETAQRRFTLLKLRFNAVVTQFDMFSNAITQRSENEFGVWLAGLDVVAADALALPPYFDSSGALLPDKGIGAQSAAPGRAFRGWRQSRRSGSHAEGAYDRQRHCVVARTRSAIKPLPCWISSPDSVRRSSGDRRPQDGTVLAALDIGDRCRFLVGRPRRVASTLG